MLQVTILGCTGYTGIELIRILTGHPHVRIVSGSSRQHAGKRISDVLPFVRSMSDFPVLDPEHIKSSPAADIAFLALPHGESAAATRPLLDAGAKVVDLSADCRIRDRMVYEEWYGTHGDPDLLPLAVYGLPEIHREAIKTADLTANPGCYPSTVILGLAPLMQRDDVDTAIPIVDSKSGISGAGRGAKLTTSFCESGEGFKPYGVIRHRHTPEMEQELSLIKGSPVKVRFTPHLIPVSRGMVSTMYIRRTGTVSAEELRQGYRDFYKDEPFVTILPAGSFPDTAHVRGTNMCTVSVEVDERTDQIIIMSSLDNLVKGASGAAVQNMNLMTGLDETAGLQMQAMFP